MKEKRKPMTYSQLQHERNLVKFHQVVVDLANILEEIEAGRMEDVWFLRRINAALLGVTFITDEQGRTRCVSWRDGKCTIGHPEPTPIAEIRGRLEEKRLSSNPPADRMDFYDASLEEKKRRDGVALSE